MAIILAAVVVEAGDQGQVARSAGDGLQPMHGAAVELAVEGHHATTRVGRVGDTTGELVGNRQVLNHAPPPRIRIHLQRCIAEVPLVIRPQLLVIDAFARVVR